MIAGDIKLLPTPTVQPCGHCSRETASKKDSQQAETVVVILKEPTAQMS